MDSVASPYYALCSPIVLRPRPLGDTRLMCKLEHLADMMSCALGLSSGLPVWAYTSYDPSDFLFNSLTLEPSNTEASACTAARCLSSCRLATFLMCSRNHSLEYMLLCDWPASFSWFLLLVFGWFTGHSLLFIDRVVETRYVGFEDTRDLQL